MVKVTKHAQATSSVQVRNRLTEFVSICAEWTRTRQAHIALAQPPIHLPPAIRSIPRRGHLLADSDRLRKAAPDLHAWPHAGVVSGRYPLLVAVMEGEADFRIGLTEAMKQTAPELPDDHEMQVLQAPRGAMLFIPPGVPFSDGDSIPHWERPEIEKAASTILWCYFVSHGALLYYCTTRGTDHTYSGSMFLLDPRLLAITEILLDSMMRGRGRMDNVDHTLMLALLLSIERDCRSHQDRLAAWPELADEPGGPGEPARIIFGNDDQAIDRARQYIETHLHRKDAMNVAQIAAHAFVSSSHLNRLFRSRLNCSILEFVVSRRMDLAKRLLHESDLSISEISRTVGYTRPNYFARAFSKSTGRQPGEWRAGRFARQGQHPKPAEAVIADRSSPAGNK